MKIQAAAVLLSVLCCFLPAPVVAQFRNVHIEVESARGSGKGIAVSRGLDCFVITAHHVVADPLPITVIGAHRKRSGATIVFKKPKLDLAVIQVKRPVEICGRDFYMEFDNLTDRIRTNRTGVLRVRLEDGSEQEITLSIGQFSLRPPHHFHVWAVSGEPQLGQGHSGGIFYVGGRPAGILTTVRTRGRPGGLVLRVDRAAEAIAAILPLRRPPEERSRYDDQLAADILRKNVNYLGTPEFCRSLWKLGKWVAKPESRFSYTAKRQSGAGGYDYDIDSILIPGVNSILNIEQRQSNKERRSVTTTIGVIPTSMDLEPVWRRLENLIKGCMSSDINEEIKKVVLRQGLHRHSSSKITMWTVERTGFLGIRMESADIWLALRSSKIQIDVWTTN